MISIISKNTLNHPRVRQNITRMSYATYDSIIRHPNHPVEIREKRFEKAKFHFIISFQFPVKQ